MDGGGGNSTERAVPEEILHRVADVSHSVSLNPLRRLSPLISAWEAFVNYQKSLADRI